MEGGDAEVALGNLQKLALMEHSSYLFEIISCEGLQFSYYYLPV